MFSLRASLLLFYPRSRQIVHFEQADAGPVRHGAQLHNWRRVRLSVRQSGGHTPQAPDLGHGRLGVLPLRHQNILQSSARRVSLLLNNESGDVQQLRILAAGGAGLVLPGRHDLLSGQ